MVKFDIKRSMTRSEIAEVTELLNVVERADGQRPLSDHLWIDLSHGSRAGFAGLTAWQSGINHPIAYCQVSRGNDSWAIDLVVDPRNRNEFTELGLRLFLEAKQIIASEGGGHVHWWVSRQTATHTDLASQIGFRPGRNILQMRVDLPLTQLVIAQTKTILTQEFRVGIDEEIWIKVNNRAFANHPEQGGWTSEILKLREAEPWFNPNDFLMHFSERPVYNQLVGFCWTKVDAATKPVLGEIYAIAVDPLHHGQGLGRALTVAGLNHLAGRGMTTGMLFVDKGNLPAIKMYSKIGFRTHHEEQAFVGDIASSAK